MMQRPRLLVVEDDLGIRSALETALRIEGYEAHAEADGTRLSEAAQQFNPDLAVLDVRLPAGPDGYAMAGMLRLSSTIPIIFLSAAGGVDDRLAGFQAGGDDYVVKPFSMAEFMARITALLRRSGRLTSQSWTIGDLLIDDGARTAIRAGVPLVLTRTEYDLLLILVQHRGRVLSKPQLLTQVWGFDSYDTNLVEVHMSALRRKLEMSGPRLIHTVRGSGYVLRG